MLPRCLLSLAILAGLAAPAMAYELQTGGLQIVSLAPAASNQLAGNQNVQSTGRVNPAAIPLLFAAQRAALNQSGKKGGTADAGTPDDANTARRQALARNKAANSDSGGILDSVLDAFGVSSGPKGRR